MGVCIIFLTACGDAAPAVHNEWNNGICVECGGQLIYHGTGSKEHYVCEKCQKEYTFDELMVRK